MLAPDWFRTEQSPTRLRPPPPPLPSRTLEPALAPPLQPPQPPQPGGPAASGSHAAPGQQRSAIPALPPVPAAPNGVATAPPLALPPPPPLAALPAPPGGAPPPPPRDPTTGGGAGGGSVIALALADASKAQAAARASAPGPGARAGTGKVNMAPPVADEKAFMIPGLQSKPYTEDEVALAFEMMDLDRHGVIDAQDIRRCLSLCGEGDISDEEVVEMIRLCDPNGFNSVKFEDFSELFMDPPPVFRNFDLYRRKDLGRGATPQAPGGRPELAGIGPSTPSQGATPSQGRRPVSGGGVSEELPPDPRAEAVALIAGGRRLRPEFIRHVYQRFIEIDDDERGMVTYEDFCLILQKPESADMKRAFDLFDHERIYELDLRHFVVGLSMYTISSIHDKLRFAFMMYDEEQSGTIDREVFLELLYAIAPHFLVEDREWHVNAAYSMLNLHPSAVVQIEDFISYATNYAEELLPYSTGTPSIASGPDSTQSSAPTPVGAASTSFVSGRT